MSKYWYFLDYFILRRFPIEGGSNGKCGQMINATSETAHWVHTGYTVNKCVECKHEELTEAEVFARYPHLNPNRDAWIEEAAEEICDIDIEDGSFLPPRIAAIIRKHFEGRPR